MGQTAPALKAGRCGPATGIPDGQDLDYFVGMTVVEIVIRSCQMKASNVGSGDFARWFAQAGLERDEIEGFGKLIGE